MDIMLYSLLFESTVVTAKQPIEFTQLSNENTASRTIVLTHVYLHDNGGFVFSALP